MSALYPQGESKLTATQTPEISTKPIEIIPELGVEANGAYESHTIGEGTAHVNVFTQNIVGSFTDFELATKGVLGYAFTRTYNAQSEETSALGQGWTFAGNEKLQEITSDTGELREVMYTDADGTKHRFPYSQEKQVFSRAVGTYYNLVKESNQSYTLSTPDQLKWHFEPDGKEAWRLHKMTDRFGNAILFTYNASGQLKEIKEANGRGNKIEIISYEGDYIKVIKYGNLRLTFTYKDDKQTAAVLTSSRRIGDEIGHTYAYESGDTVWTITDNKGSVVSFKKEGNDLVVTEPTEKQENKRTRYNRKDNEFNVLREVITTDEKSTTVDEKTVYVPTDGLAKSLVASSTQFYSASEKNNDFETIGYKYNDKLELK
ncbi:MAG: DUF6531 domain-containing protein, partial [Bacilli bacterium]